MRHWFFQGQNSFEWIMCLWNEVLLRFTTDLSAALVLEHLGQSLSFFFWHSLFSFFFLFEKRPASCTLDIRLSRFLNKKILWRTKVVGRGCSAKKVCFKKFLKVYRKRPVSETLFDKVADSQPGNLSKKKLR